MISRRLLLRAGFGGLMAGAAGLGYSTLIEPGRIVTEKVVVPIPELPLALEGFRIAVLSDFTFTLSLRSAR